MKLVDATHRLVEIAARHQNMVASIDIAMMRAYLLLPTPSASAVIYSRLAIYDDLLATAGIAFDSIEVPTPLTGSKNSAQGKITANGTVFKVKIQAETRQDFDALLTRVKTIQGRFYNGDSKTWDIPIGFGSAKELSRLVSEGRFEVEPGAARILTGELSKGKEAVKASSTLGTAETLPGLLIKAPRPYQVIAVKYVEQHGNSLIADDMGIGKTITALAVCAHQDRWPLLVVCPKSVKPDWRDEIKACLPGRQVQVIGPETKAIVPGMDAYITSWNLLADGWIDKKKKAVKLRPIIEQLLNPRLLMHKLPGMMVLDESHKMKERDTQQTCAVHQIADTLDEIHLDAERTEVLRLCLTGTPYPNRPRELVEQLGWLKKIDQFGGSWQFYKRYCDAKQEWIYGINHKTGQKYRKKQVWNLNGSSNEGELNERLRAVCMVRRLKKDVLKDLPPKIVAVRSVEIPDALRVEYKKAEKAIAKMAAEMAVQKQQFLDSIAHLSKQGQDVAIEKQKMHVFLRNKDQEALQKYNVLRQLLAPGKLESFREFSEDFISTGRKLVVFAWFRESQQACLKVLTELGYNPVHILGNDSDANRSEALRKIRDDSQTRAIVVSTACGAEGINLQCVSDQYHFETCFVPGIQTQAEDRCWRDGQKNTTNCWYGLARGTIDFDVWEILEDKRRSIELGLNGVSGGAEIQIGELMEKLQRRLEA